MIEMTTISAAISSLQGAANIAKGLMGLHDTVVIQGKVIELQSAILAAQSSALAAQSEQSSLIERIKELEKQITNLEAWKSEKERYSLVALSPGAHAYVLKKSAQKAEPIHTICANCYQHGHKSILQWEQGGYGSLTFKCHSCKAQFYGYTSQDTYSLPVVD
jgi:hypothetical protein